MSWRKPQKVWQWLLLLTPALELMFMPLVADPLGEFLLPDDEIPGFTLLLYNLVAALAISMALGFWLAWTFPSWPERIGNGFLFGTCIAFLNSMIALAGCTAGLVAFRR